jgi:hypothetical protein
MLIITDFNYFKGKKKWDNFALTLIFFILSVKKNLIKIFVLFSANHN